MNTKFTLKKFRCFDSKGVTIDLRPITLLTGCNSSGKSSIVKALMLLSDYFQGTNKNGKKYLFEQHLDFTKKPHNLLGNFAKVVNKKSEEGIITMAICSHSRILQENVYLELLFEQSKDELLNGTLHSFCIKRNDGTVIHSSTGIKDAGNYYSLLPNFFQYINTKAGFNSIFKTHGSSDILTEKTLEKISENGSLFYLPIFENELSGLKEECIEFLENALKNKFILRSKAKNGLEEILSNFKRSSEKDFLSWYKQEEKEYLSSYNGDSISFGLTCDETYAQKFVIKNQMWGTGWCYHIEKEDNVASGKEDDRFFHSTEKSLFSTFVDVMKQNRRRKFQRLFEVMEFLSYIYRKDDYLYKELVSFEKRDSLLGCIRKAVGIDDENIYAPHIDIKSRVEEGFLVYVYKILTEAVCSALVENVIQYVSSSVVSIKRLYPMEAEDEFTKLLKRYFENKGNGASSWEAKRFEDKWIKEFGIGDHISINADCEGLGVTIRLHKDENDKEGSLLADSGYGITQLFAIILNIEVAIMEKGSMTKERTIAIEEPEIHLHPSYQSKLSDMFDEAYKDYGIHFIIETHSEYLIRRTQVLVAQMKFTSNEEIEGTCPFTTYYVPKNGEPYALGYRKDGLFKEDFGSGFYDEASNLAFEIL